MTVISLDSSPLSLLTQRRGPAEAEACQKWLAQHLRAGTRIVVPSIVDYELRRELMRAGKTASVARLDAFLAADAARLIPMTDTALRRAASIWATARRAGLPTADPKELDIDVLQVAQIQGSGIDSASVVIATSNVGHLARFMRADFWQKL